MTQPIAPAASSAAEIPPQFQSLSVPRRRDPRPETTNQIPHSQISDNPSPELFERMCTTFLQTSGATTGPSLISVKGAQALFLCGEGADAESCPDAFMRGREFAHIHPEHDGSFHMVLDWRDCLHLMEQGWAEQHPYARTGRIPRNNLMIYAARDEEEMHIVLRIVEAAKDHATRLAGERR